MDDDLEHSSPPEESMDAFVRRKVNAERDRAAEARARQALVDSLVGRKVEPQSNIRLSQSVVMARGARDARAKRQPVREPVIEPDETEIESGVAPEDVAETVVYENESGTSDEQSVERQVVYETDAIEQSEGTAPRSRVRADTKMEAFVAVVTKAGDPRQFTPSSLITAVAQKLGVPEGGIKTHWNRYLSPEQRAYLLYGEKGRKVTRAEEKFKILLSLREELRAEGKPKPTKREFIPLAMKRLGMTELSTSTYIYERLTDAQKTQLDFAQSGNYTGFTIDEQIGILKIVRKEMRDAGLPAPRHIDLAIAAAPRLKQKVDSVRTFIASLGADVKEELEFLQSRSAKLNGLSAFHVQEGFLGALAVLRLRKMKLTRKNLQKILNMKRPVIESYLMEHPDLARQLIDEDVVPR